MRISDWSSDVCSSDLRDADALGRRRRVRRFAGSREADRQGRRQGPAARAVRPLIARRRLRPAISPDGAGRRSFSHHRAHGVQATSSAVPRTRTRPIPMKNMKTSMLLLAALALPMLSACEGSGGTDAAKAEGGYATGKVVATPGNPIAGAKMLLDATALHNPQHHTP